MTARGAKFLTEAIHACAAEARLRENNGTIEPHRLRNNLLAASLCALTCWPRWQTICHRRLTHQPAPRPTAAVQVTRVVFEYAPDRGRHLQDNSAFDAFIEYSRADGTTGFLGIETKLTEPFSQQEYPFDARYRRWQQHPAWWWKDGAEASFPRYAHQPALA